MTLRRTINPGKRERATKKRLRRVWIVKLGGVTMHVNHAYILKYLPEAAAVPLRLGRKHNGRWIRDSLAVADSRNVRQGVAL